MVGLCDNIPDFELIRRMADQNADFSGARDAWGHFYVRHRCFLSRVCMANHAWLLGEGGVKDIVDDVFMKVFDNADTFDSAEVCEPPVQERKVCAWLACIADNLVRDRFRGQPEICIVDADEMEQLGGTTDENSIEDQIPESERMKLLKSVFALLSDTEQTVLRATMFWWQADQQHQRMPHTAMEQLSKQVDKSPENIRQIRARAMKKLEKYVNENLHYEKAH
jgi:RNA polymerase sigma factor (sigma-70 family)